MAYKWRVSIPSRQGTCVIDLQHEGLVNHLRDSHGDKNLYNVAYTILGWSSLLGDSTLCDRKPDEVIRRFTRRLAFDLFGSLAQYSALSDEIIRSLRSNEGHISMAYVGGMARTPVFREYLHTFRTGCVDTLRYVLSFLNFGKKMTYDNPDLKRDALRAWKEVEKRIGNVVLPPYTKNLSIIIDWLLQGLEIPYLLPKHGAGAVSEPGVRGVEHKNVRFTIPPKASHYFDVDVFGCVVNSPTGDEPAPSNKHISYSRLKFVPKSWKAMRSICMEPIPYQYLQQGVRYWIEDHMSQSILSEHVRLDDQRVNQVAALIGSRTNTVDTIDLSAASDSVSWKLVKQVFPREVIKHFHMTRSERVLTSAKGRPIKIHKFAPMGSSLCFPTQTILYSAVVLLIEMCMRHDLDWRDPDVLLGVDLDQLHADTYHPHIGAGTAPLFRSKIYGDDIACNSLATSSIIECLTTLGFKVNEDKSFTGDQAYRESCGEHYVAGKKVTPYYLKVKDVQCKSDISTIGSIIDAANRAWEYGYLTLRKVLVQMALYSEISGYTPPGPCNEILFSSDTSESMAIYHPNPSNRNLRTRSFRYDNLQLSGSHVRFQRKEVYRLMSTYVGDVVWSAKHDQYRYLQWWRSHHEEKTVLQLDQCQNDPTLLALWWRSRELEREAVDILAASTKRDVAGAKPYMGWTPM